MSNTRKIKRTPGTTYRTIGDQRVPVVPQDPRIQDVIDDDAQFFNAHPDIWERIRPWVPGELRDEYGREDAPANNLVRVLRLERENPAPKHPNDGPLRVRIRGDIPLPPDLRAQLHQMQQAGMRAGR